MGKMENPGARASASGAVFKAGNFAEATTTAQLEAIADRHRRACNVFGYALALDNPEGWTSLSYIAHARLTPQETAMAAYAFMRPLTPRMRQRIFEAAQWGLHHEA